MVEVWIAEVQPFFQEQFYQKYYEKLPTWRKEKADRCKQPDDRVLSVAAWSLWHQVKEKRHLPDDAVYNLSHSGKYVLCAYSTLPREKVGCDVEMLGELRLKVAERFFCEEEYVHLQAIKNEDEKRRLFYRYWVLKESFMKATRQGMALDTRDFEICWEKDCPYLGKRPAEYQEKYIYREYSLDAEDAVVAICTTDTEIDQELHIIEWN